MGEEGRRAARTKAVGEPGRGQRPSPSFADVRQSSAGRCVPADDDDARRRLRGRPDVSIRNRRPGPVRLDALTDQLLAALNLIWDAGLLKTYRQESRRSSSPKGRLIPFDTALSTARAGRPTALSSSFERTADFGPNRVLRLDPVDGHDEKWWPTASRPAPLWFALPAPPTRPARWPPPDRPGCGRPGPRSADGLYFLGMRNPPIRSRTATQPPGHGLPRRNTG